MCAGKTMQIWVDADACPKAIKDILFRMAERTGITIALVANQYLPVRHHAIANFYKSDRVMTWLIMKLSEN